MQCSSSESTLSNASKHSLARTLTFHQNDEIIGIAGELVAASLKFFIQGIEHNIRQQR